MPTRDIPNYGRRRVVALGVTAGISALLGLAGYEAASPSGTGRAQTRGTRRSTCAPDGSSGETFVGSFYSRYREREEHYRVAYPPGYRRGDPLPLLLTCTAMAAATRVPTEG